ATPPCRPSPSPPQPNATPSNCSAQRSRSPSGSQNQHATTAMEPQLRPGLQLPKSTQLRSRLLRRLRAWSALLRRAALGVLATLVMVLTAAGSAPPAWASDRPANGQITLGRFDPT